MFLLNVFRYNSNNCFCFFAITSKIIPVINNKSAITNEIIDTISDGNFGTSPVLKYSINTGNPNINDISKKIMVHVLKNNLGLYSLTSSSML